LLNGARFGAAEISFKGSAGKLYPRFCVAWFSLLAMIVALPLFIGRFGGSPYMPLAITGTANAAFLAAVCLIAHYNQQAYRHILQSMTVGELRFRFVGRRRGLVKLYLTNLVMNLASAGLAYYYTRLRIAKYMASQIVVDGDPSCLLESTPSDNKRPVRLGEGLDALVAASYL
jgi:uncharacterized membrane protein YjgN (DUF898 family)